MTGRVFVLYIRSIRIMYVATINFKKVIVFAVIYSLSLTIKTNIDRFNPFANFRNF